MRKTPRRIFQTVRAGIGLLPRIMDYLTARNEALLAEDVGLGEYLYLYNIVYYAELDHSPADGPPFTITDNDEGSQSDSRRRNSDDDDEEEEWEARKRRSQRIRRQLNAVLLPMLRHQRADLEAGGQRIDADWLQALTNEIAAVSDRPLRLPWSDGLPAPMAESLKPYRHRLAESYSEMCNPLELMAISGE
jgi:hypothetical protein